MRTRNDSDPLIERTLCAYPSVAQWVLRARRARRRTPKGSPYRASAFADLRVAIAVQRFCTAFVALERAYNDPNVGDPYAEREQYLGYLRCAAQQRCHEAGTTLPEELRSILYSGGVSVG